MEGNQDEVRELTEETIDENGNTSLHRASLNGQIFEVTELLNRSVDVNKVNKNHETALHQAIIGNHPNVARLLIQENVNVNHISKNGTALHVAVEKNQIGLVRVLVDNGANINKFCYKGFTPLHLAACNGNNDMLITLIHKGADINKDNTIDSNTALHYSVQNNHIDVVKILLYKGINVKVINTDKKTALDCAKKKGFEDIANLLSKNNGTLNDTEKLEVEEIFIATIRKLNLDASQGEGLTVNDQITSTPPTSTNNCNNVTIQSTGDIIAGKVKILLLKK